MVNNSLQFNSLQQSLAKVKTNTGHILIVDDTPNNLRFLSDLLSKAGYAVRKVVSGELGLEAARLEPPDLILLDIRMPGLDGYQVCGQLKASQRTSEIPVIFLSAMDEELDKVMAFEAGGVDYITKPFQVVEVLARIETHLQISHLRKTLTQQNLQLQQEIARRTSVETALDTLSRIPDTQQPSLLQQTESRQSFEQIQRYALQAQSLTSLVEQLTQSLDEIESALGELDQSRHPDQTRQTISTTLQSMRQALQTTALAPTISPRSVSPHSVSPRSVDLLEFCQAFCDEWLLPTVPNYQLSVLSQGTPVSLSIDEVLLKQVLTQLFNNAIRYSPLGGSLVLQVIYEPTQVLLQVRDEGIGIAAKQLANINSALEDWTSLSSLPNLAELNQASGKGPLGMGLTVAKQVLRQQGGNIRLSSEQGQGTTVTLTLPMTLPIA